MRQLELSDAILFSCVNPVESINF